MAKSLQPTQVTVVRPVVPSVPRLIDFDYFRDRADVGRDSPREDEAGEA